MKKKVSKLPPGNCPFCDTFPTAWGLSPEGWERAKRHHDAGHPLPSEAIKTYIKERFNPLQEDTNSSLCKHSEKDVSKPSQPSNEEWDCHGDLEKKIFEIADRPNNGKWSVMQACYDIKTLLQEEREKAYKDGVINERMRWGAKQFAKDFTQVFKELSEE